MKKKIVCMFAVASLLSLTACADTYQKDCDHAYAEITTSDGVAYVVVSYHGNNYYYEGKRQETAVEKATTVSVEDGVTANVHFHCSQCGYDEVLEDEKVPYARLFSCECNGAVGSENPREYIAILIGSDSYLEDATINE